jgi:hypothetical protein
MTKLHHKKQPNGYGCLYHSAYALTGDVRFLEGIRNANPFRLQVRAQELGFVRVHFFVHQDGYTDNRGYIKHLMSEVEANEYLPMLLTYRPAKRQLTDLHVVAVHIQSSHVMVSDSNKDAIQCYDYDEFLESEYAKPIVLSWLESFEQMAAYDLDVPSAQAAEHLAKLEAVNSDLEMTPDVA